MRDDLAAHELPGPRRRSIQATASIARDLPPQRSASSIPPVTAMPLCTAGAPCLFDPLICRGGRATPTCLRLWFGIYRFSFGLACFQLNVGPSAPSAQVFQKSTSISRLDYTAAGGVVRGISPSISMLAGFLIVIADARTRLTGRPYAGVARVPACISQSAEN